MLFNHLGRTRVTLKFSGKNIQCPKQGEIFTKISATIFGFQDLFHIFDESFRLIIHHRYVERNLVDFRGKNSMAQIEHISSKREPKPYYMLGMKFCRNLY